MRLTVDFVMSAVSGSLLTAAYAAYPKNPSFHEDKGFMLGGGILLLLEMTVALLCMTSERVYEMTDPYRNALFRAHELFALFLVSPFFKSQDIEEYNIFFPGAYILLATILSNAIIIGNESTEYVIVEENKLRASRFLIFVAGLLWTIDLFEDITVPNFLGDNTYFSLFFFLMVTHMFFEMFSDWEFSQNYTYVVAITIFTTLTDGGLYAFELHNGVDITEGQKLKIAATILAIFGVAAVHFKGRDGGYAYVE